MRFSIGHIGKCDGKMIINNVPMQLDEREVSGEISRRLGIETSRIVKVPQWKQFFFKPHGGEDTVQRLCRQTTLPWSFVLSGDTLKIRRERGEKICVEPIQRNDLADRQTSVSNITVGGFFPPPPTHCYSEKFIGQPTPFYEAPMAYQGIP